MKKNKEELKIQKNVLLKLQEMHLDYLLLNLQDFNSLNSFKVSLFYEHSDHTVNV